MAGAIKQVKRSPGARMSTVRTTQMLSMQGPFGQMCLAQKITRCTLFGPKVAVQSQAQRSDYPEGVRFQIPYHLRYMMLLQTTAKVECFNGAGLQVSG